MPEGGDPASVGYLIAATVVTVAALAGYALMLAGRLSSSRERHAQVRATDGERPPDR